MAIIRRPPFDLNRFLENSDLSPDMDVYESDDEITAKIHVPGFEPDKVEVKVKNDVLRVSGKKEEQQEEKQKNFIRHEIRTGSFMRQIRLPSKVKEDQVEATYANGVLEIRMPKAEPKEGKKVEIKVEKVNK